MMLNFINVMEKKRIAVELFSGSKTVTHELRMAGFKVFSVDNNPKLCPDFCCDVLNYPSFFDSLHIDFGWYSPPCYLFSRAAAQRHWTKITNKYRQYTYLPNSPEAVMALRILEKTIDFVKLHPESKFVIENPIGRIHHTAALKSIGHYRYAVNYADFGFKYSKETYLFTNFLLPFSSKKVHSDFQGLRSVNSEFQRSKVPSQLIQTIINYL